MSATDELCRLLEERNEEYDIRDNSGGLPSYVLVVWYFNLADRAYFYGYPDGRTKLITYRCTYDLTPEQAIDATLGAGTCHPVISDNLTESEGTGDAWADCSECGHLLFVLTDPNSQVPNYCPNCGAKVVDA